MKNLRRVYLSIGSNVGDKVANLQQATSLIEQKIGDIAAISKVYQTPAWGFDSDDFYNACISVNTKNTPQEVLHTLLKIEKDLGRIRSTEEGYQPRIIDLDIIFYEDDIIAEKDLILPHPHMQNRKFVLQPLHDIAPGKVHPQLLKSVEELLLECNDNSTLTETTIKISFTKNDFSNINFVAIEGNIGVGKTTLATKISNDFNGKLILESFADNPFLPKFYEDTTRYAFPLEMAFLADRYQQFTDDTNQPDLFNNFMVSDYDIFKSLIFAKVTLQEEEFKLYRKIFNFMYKDVVKPDVYVYLHQNTDRLLQNIKKRGRTYEQKIPASYLEDINKAYYEFMRSQTDLKVLIIDVSNLDFVKNDTDYHHIINLIHDFHSNS
ncbi:2-amino-4-hydroxy-6-hydroxymethyldihydropteridine diphosphokinase [Zhouia sp. PK063]|uniref:2-amino-4-hydroxy-6- hydroxymethyldihydropteridine diphosphokinase n=1 Tax=Zhouia sp. PK063 TaxID=3373602 RepID=UPI0037BA6AA1